jgi:plasmid maintenance system antidote protein VapI
LIHFGYCLKKAQAQTGISSAELARMLGVHRQQINIWRRKDNCRLSTAIDVCEALGYSLDEFVALQI